MVQGTGSYVGKSVVTAALCQYFREQGYRVAPFKAQNMSNNSHLTKSGGEIGFSSSRLWNRANRRNESGAAETTQVVVLGKPVSHMPAREYHQYQSERSGNRSRNWRPNTKWL
jgi:adenosylcobyric acid synthase